MGLLLLLINFLQENVHSIRASTWSIQHAVKHIEHSLLLVSASVSDHCYISLSLNLTFLFESKPDLVSISWLKLMFYILVWSVKGIHYLSCNYNNGYHKGTFTVAFSWDNKLSLIWDYTCHLFLQCSALICQYFWCYACRSHLIFSFCISCTLKFKRLSLYQQMWEGNQISWTPSTNWSFLC